MPGPSSIAAPTPDWTPVLPSRDWRSPGAVMSGGLACGCIVAGAGLYGLAIGSWRSPLQAVFTGVKFPLILLATAVGNSLISALLAPLLGLRMGFRESLSAVLSTFATLSLILGSLGPAVVFLVWSLPGAEAGWEDRSRAFYLLQSSQVACIGAAGTAAVVRLRHHLERRGGSAAVARRVLAAWLSIHLLLGSQLTWILRPFFGQHALPVQFLRPAPLDGNFFETLAFSLRHLAGSLP